MYHSKEVARFCAPACLALLLLPSASQADISFNLSSIARPGDAVPVPAKLRQVGSPSVNDSGQVAFAADNAVFLQSSGVTTIVAAFGDPVPGGGTFIAARMPSVNVQGQVAFAADVAPPGRSGIFLWSEGSIRPIAQAGDAVPGGGTFSAFFELSVRGAGELVEVPFSGRTSLGEEAVFLFSRDTVHLLARGGDPAPGGGTFLTFYFPVANINEQVAFYSDLGPTGSGIFLRQADGTLTTVARAGDPAPGGGTFESSTAFSTPNQHLEVTGDRVRSVRLLDPLPLGHPSLDTQDVARQSLGDGSATFSYFTFPAASINDRGEVAFPAQTSMVGRGGIFVFFEGQITRRIRELDPAPGGGVFDYMDSASFNAAGQIAFRAYTSILPGSGVFLFSNDGSIIQVAGPQQPSPEGDIFTGASVPSLNAGGQVAFTGEFLSSLGGVYLFSQGSISRVAGQDDTINRDPQFIDPYPRGINRAGGVVFSARVFPGGSGLFAGAPTAVIARVGDAAPEGGVFNYISNLPTVSDSGQAAIAGSTTMGVSGLYSYSDGLLSRIVGSGDPAPGGGIFYGFNYPSINNNGDVAFMGYATAPSPWGLFVFSGGQIRRLVSFGGPAPGGGTFTGLAFLSLNDAGQLAFSALVTAPGRSGIFLWSEGSVRAIAQTGDPAPGGDTFNFRISLSDLYRPSLNASGQVAFGAPLSMGSSGVFLSTGDPLTSVAREGDPAPGGGTITFADSASLNDAGQIAFPAGTTTSGFLACLFSGGTIVKIAGGGDPAPGGGTFAYTDFPKINSQTQATFVGGVPGGSGAFLATPGE